MDQKFKRPCQSSVIHIWGDIHSGVHCGALVEKLNRDRFLRDLNPKYQILESKPLMHTMK